MSRNFDLRTRVKFTSANKMKGNVWEVTRKRKS